jgi:hypothetical protein
MREYFSDGVTFSDETGIHFDVKKFWDNDISTVLKRWEETKTDEEIEAAINNIRDQWKEYVNKIGRDTALKIVSHICGETGSTNEQIAGLLRQFLFVELKGGNLENYLDDVVNVIQDKEREDEQELAPDTQAPEAGSKIPDFVLSIAGYYPQFMNHYPKLEKAEYIRATDKGLQWQKSKQSLAEYFTAIKPKDKSNNWIILENIFSVNDLRNAASQNGNPFKGKKSKDFVELQKIITIITRL